MITIQSGMLIALGFLAAVLLGLLIAPALWRRAVRLTTHRVKMSIPLSETEIEADRDRIRAEYAIKMHKLEMLVEQVKLAGARQQIEINRRDARVNMLEADLEQLRAGYEEAQNARRVLEQTIESQLPRVGERLAEARKVLDARERELADLASASEKQVRALAAARALDEEHRGEIERLKEALSAKLPAGEAGLHAELQALRTKAREQAELIDKLQSRASRFSKAAGAVKAVQTADDAEAIARQAELERELTALRSQNEDQAAEIAKLKGAVEVFEKNADGEMLGSVRESRLALKARLQALEAQTQQQSDTIAKLRGELADANERLAQQAVQFTDELKRVSATEGYGARRAGGNAARTSLAERIGRANNSRDEEAAPAEAAVANDELATAGSAQVDEAKPEPRVAGAHAQGEGRDAMPSVAQSEGEVVTAPPEAPVAQKPAQRIGKRIPAAQRPRLLDRIAGLSRTS